MQTVLVIKNEQIVQVCLDYTRALYWLEKQGWVRTRVVDSQADPKPFEHLVSHVVSVHEIDASIPGSPHPWNGRKRQKFYILFAQLDWAGNLENNNG